MQIGDTVHIPSAQSGRILALIDLFGQRYADVFIEPSGPLLRLPLEQVQERQAAPAVGDAVPAPLFIARLAAYQLQALLTQGGVLSAANFRIAPLPHQVLAVDFVLGQFRPRVVIADEVGLGKTIEAALIYEELKLRRQARRALVIAPAGLTRQWQDEFEQKFGEHFVIYDRALLQSLLALHGQQANLWLQHERVITSLDFVKPQRLHPALAPAERQRREALNRRLFSDLAQAGWDIVIFDEAHKLSKHADGSETARYKVGQALAAAAPVFLLLSATPHQGDAGRFLHLLNLVDPYAFNQVSDLRPEAVSRVVWRTRKRAAVDAQGRRIFKERLADIYPVDRSGAAHTLERQLYDEVTAYVSESYNRAAGRGDQTFTFLMILFQRMVVSSTQAIHSALGKRLEKLLALQKGLVSRPPEGAGLEDLDAESAAEEDGQQLLETLLDRAGLAEGGGLINSLELGKEIETLTHLLDLARRALRTPDAKQVALGTIVDEIRRREGPNTKFLIFTEFVATQEALRQALEGLGFKTAAISGQQSLDERIRARQAFAGRLTPPEEAQFLISTDAGGEGINLQFCHVLINYDLPWNPMRLEQRIGRLDRIGQEYNVLVLNLLIGDTVESRVRQVLEDKLGLIRKQYGDDKLADILSTLQDEFQFDRLYMDALRLRQAQSAELESIAQQIYQRARQILEQDDLLLPQAQAEVAQYRQKLVEVSGSRLRTLVEGYLLAHGEQLHPYSRRPGVFYFDLPEKNGARQHYPQVVFERQAALDDDGLDYLHLNHPLIRRLLDELEQAVEAGWAQLRLQPGALRAGLPRPASLGFWGLYRLRLTNHADLERLELTSVVLDASGQSYPRLAQALLDLHPAQVEAARLPLETLDLAARRQQLWQAAERRAGDSFSEAQLAHAQRLEAERQRVERYYRQQESAIGLIAIENIRQARQRELLDRRRADLQSLEQRRTLIPDLKLLSLALLDLQPLV